MKLLIVALFLISTAFAGTENYSIDGYPFCADLVEGEYYDLHVKYCEENTDWSISDICADIVENENYDAYDRYCYREDALKDSYSCESKIKKEIAQKFNEFEKDYRWVRFVDLRAGSSLSEVEEMWDIMGLKVIAVEYVHDSEYNQFLVTLTEGCTIKDLSQLIHLDT